MDSHNIMATIRSRLGTRNEPTLAEAEEVQKSRCDAGKDPPAATQEKFQGTFKEKVVT
jgi:hypothetical protein